MIKFRRMILPIRIKRLICFGSFTPYHQCNDILKEYDLRSGKDVDAIMEDLISNKFIYSVNVSLGYIQA